MSNKPVILVNHLLEPPCRISGITRYLFALLQQLSLSSNYRYVLATTWSAADLPALLRDGSIGVMTLPFHESMPINVLCQMATVSRLMRETGAVLEFNCNPIGCFRAGWPRVITVHDLYFEVMPSLYPWRHRFWWQLMFPLSLRSAAGVICVSGNTRRELEMRHPGSRNKLVVVHEAGVAEGDAPVTPSTIGAFEAPYGLYVGNVSPNKNPTVLIEALKILYARGAAPTIYHVGNDSAGLLAEAQQRILPDHPVRRAGPLSDGELAAAYRGASCLVNTSLHEGFCLPLVEAQSLGVPIICADIPVLREVAGEGALFFPPSDAEALAERLRAVFDDSALQQRLAAASLENAGRFSWRRAADETERVFDAVLENSRTQRVHEFLMKGAEVL
jgi:glycosyltransferase involved in cell wall biosynthesis